MYISPSEHVRIMRCMSDVVKHSLVLVVVNSYCSEACVIMCTYVHVMRTFNGTCNQSFPLSGQLVTVG